MTMYKDSWHPLVSIVILNYNGLRFIEPCLRSVLNTNYPLFEVILIDNASTDGSFEMAKKLFGSDPRVRIIRNDKNLGFAKGNNIGFKYTKGDYVVFLNNDTEVDQNWLKELVKVMESSSIIGVAQCKLLQIYDRNLIDSTGGFIDFLGYSYLRGESEEDKGQYNQAREIFYADGAALAIKRNVINETTLNIAPFDPNHIAYYEDSDLCWRVQLRGYGVVFVPTSVVYHARSARKLYEMPPQLIFHSTKNHLMSLIKNYGLGKLLKYILPLLTLETLRAFALSKNRSDHSLAILKAIVWNVRNLKQIWRNRQIAQHFIRRTSDFYAMKHMKNLNLVHLYHKFKSYYGVYP